MFAFARSITDDGAKTYFSRLLDLFIVSGTTGEGSSLLTKFLSPSLISKKIYSLLIETLRLWYLFESWLHALFLIQLVRMLSLQEIIVNT